MGNAFEFVIGILCGVVITFVGEFLFLVWIATGDNKRRK